jgi:queuine/archaeosine tRNA-ribosyltransferase
MTIHNLAFLEEVVRGARDAIRDGAMNAYREAILGGQAPWEAA